MIITDEETRHYNINRACYKNAVIEAAGEVVEVEVLQYISVSVQVTGTFTGTLQFESSNNGVLWVARSLISNTGTSASSATAAGLWGADIGGRFFRVRASALTVGTPNIFIVAATASASTFLGTQPVSITGLLVTEDSVLASGASGIAVLGHRVPTTPAAQTSAAGDAGFQAITAEGKVILAGTGAEELLWQASTDFTTTGDVALKASAGAGIRNYLTDITIENTGAAEIRVLIKDGTTRVLSVTLPGKGVFTRRYGSPVKGTAATALNVALSATGTVSVHATGYIGI